MEEKLTCVSLPPEPGTIEVRADGSVTVAGHRVRLKTVYDAVQSTPDLKELTEVFPTIDPPLLAKVCEYIARYSDAVQQHVKEEEQEFALQAKQGVRVSLSELKRRAGQ